MELLNRREFLEWLALAGVAGGCRSFGDEASYSVSVLGDMHYDAAPDTVYHAEFKKLFDGTGRFANRYATFSDMRQCGRGRPAGFWKRAESA